MQAVIETAEVLVACSCEHCHVLTAQELEESKADPVLASQTLSRVGCPEGTTLQDVLTQTDPQYMQLPVPCDKPTCKNIDSESWNGRLCGAFQQMEDMISKLITAYVELGYGNHNVVPAVRAKCANNKICETTHRQFGIEQRGADQDPFFAPLRKIVNLLMRTHVLQSSAMMKPSVIKVLLKTLNGVRANANVLSAQMDNLATGVQYLQQMELDGNFVKQQHRIPSKWERRRMILAQSILPTKLFEQAVRRKWRSRIHHLLEFLRERPAVRIHSNTHWNL